MTTHLKLRCTKCGWDQFKLSAHQLDGNGSGVIDAACGRCGSQGSVGFIEDIDPPQLQTSREPAAAS